MRVTGQGSAGGTDGEPSSRTVLHRAVAAPSLPHVTGVNVGSKPALQRPNPNWRLVAAKAATFSNTAV